MSKQEIYQQRKNHWGRAEATVNSVLGGFGHYHEYDVSCSKWMLDLLISEGLLKKGGRAIDCCCGIGRVTKNILQHYFDEIDLFDQSEKLINQARIDLSENEKIGQIEIVPIQNFEFNKKYDVIWSQWSIENVEDDDAIEFINKCSANLKEGGLIIVRENICEEIDGVLNLQNHKIRSKTIIKEFYKNAGMQLVKEYIPVEWPNEILRIGMFVFKNP